MALGTTVRFNVHVSEPLGGLCRMTLCGNVSLVGESVTGLHDGCNIMPRVYG